MKILLISHIFPPAVDGGSRVINKIGEYFERNHHQTLYLSSDCSSTDDFVKSNYKKSKAIAKNYLKIPLYHRLYRPIKLINLFLKNETLSVFKKGPIFKLIPFIKSVILITKFKPDLIIAGPLPTTIIFYANFFKKITKAKLLINASFHSSDKNFYQKPLIKALKKADYLWTLSQSESNLFINKFKIKASKIILAGNGVDEKFLIQKEKATRVKTNNILFIGSLAAHKGVDLLIKSFNDLKADSKLTIAGQKSLYFPKINKLIKSLNPKVKSKINLLFNFKQSDLAKIIDSSSFLVLASNQESFGLVLIEAWARKKAVICSDLPPLKELVNKTQGGLTFKVNNQKDLSKKIEYLLNNPKVASQLGQSGYNYVKNNYTWNKVGDQIWQKIS